MSNNRTVEVQRDMGRWVRIDFKDLHKGDNFKMFEANGDEVEHFAGETLFHATSNPYWDEENETWEIDILT